MVGGLAVSARGEPRFTRDIDLALAVADDAMAEARVRDLVGRGYRVLASIEQEATGRLATVRLEAPGENAQGVVVDLLNPHCRAGYARGRDLMASLARHLGARKGEGQSP